MADVVWAKTDDVTIGAGTAELALLVESLNAMQPCFLGPKGGGRSTGHLLVELKDRGDLRFKVFEPPDMPDKVILRFQAALSVSELCGPRTQFLRAIERSKSGD
ncbi:hypothetical protein AB1L42_18315 [Thalassoglobus sp. JC818]|uniref:hypothetical protein n=1 Tax=Thalassoglobus sp. JC818 TaxID=3232136 RepID=UPI003459C52A